MPSLKEVRTRISSVISTKQITSAMKMVSAAKLRRAQTAILKLRPYSNKLNEILGNLKSSVEDTDEVKYYRERAVEKVLLIVVTSNRGLCGAFNSSAIKLAEQTIRERFADQNKAGNVSVLCVGKKGSDYFTRKKYNLTGNHNELYDNLTYDNSVKISSALMNDFTSGTYDRIEIIYNQFKNAAVQQLVCEQFLPIPHVTTAAENKKDNTDYIFEPGKAEIVEELIPRSLRLRFYKSILDSFASEHGARMAAMHKATDNAGGILKDLRLTYNKARQATITKEILEIIAGANALKN